MTQDTDDPTARGGRFSASPKLVALRRWLPVLPMILTFSLQLALLGLVFYMFYYTTRALAKLDEPRPMPPIEVRVDTMPIANVMQKTKDELRDRDAKLDEMSRGLESKVRKLDGLEQDVRDLQQKLERLKQPEPSRTVIPTDVVVLALNSPQLNQREFLASCFTKVFTKRFSGVEDQHRIALYIATTGEITRIFSFDKPIKPDLFDVQPPMSEKASEELDDVGKYLSEWFGNGPKNGTRRCVIVASTECRVPQTNEWDDYKVDAVLVASKESLGDIHKWNEFCARHQGMVCVVAKTNDSGYFKEVGDRIRRLTNPVERIE